MHSQYYSPWQLIVPFYSQPCTEPINPSAARRPEFFHRSGFLGSSSRTSAIRRRFSGEATSSPRSSWIRARKRDLLKEWTKRADIPLIAPSIKEPKRAFFFLPFGSQVCLGSWYLVFEPDRALWLKQGTFLFSIIVPSSASPYADSIAAGSWELKDVQAQSYWFCHTRFYFFLL